jgi:hypothetical protein
MRRVCAHSVIERTKEMLEVMAYFAIYGMGVGITLAVHGKLFKDDWEGIEILIASLWPVTLPAIVMWWAVTSWLGSKE